MSRTARIAMSLVAVLAAASCSDEEYDPPAFIHIESLQLTPDPTNQLPVDSGFFTSDIVACYVAAHYAGSNKLDTIGLYQLPFTAPVRHNGSVDYFEIYPAVQQSGSSSALPYYTFYQPITLKKHTFRLHDTLFTDTLFLRPFDTLDLGTVETHYAITRNNILFYEGFEPTSISLFFDSVEWHKYAPSESRCGVGYASVHVPDTAYTVPFSIKNTWHVANPTSLLYLELDSRSDLPFEVYMEASYTSGGNAQTERVMVINPSTDWRHLYINLGRTWSWFNHPQDFRITFAALNIDAEEGDIRIDNVRLITK